MSEPTLRDAAAVLRERKLAGLGDITVADMMRGEAKPDGRLLLVGTGLDPDELDECALEVAASTLPTLTMLAQQGHPEQALAGSWIDGILTACALHDLRATASAKREAGAYEALGQIGDSLEQLLVVWRDELPVDVVTRIRGVLVLVRNAQIA